MRKMRKMKENESNAKKGKRKLWRKDKYGAKKNMVEKKAERTIERKRKISKEGKRKNVK